MHSPAHTARNGVKNVWKRSKSAPTDRCYPLSVSTTQFGFSKQEHFTFVSFYGQSLRPWRQARDSFRKKLFTLSCFLLRNREISRTLHAIPFSRWCRYRQTNYYDMRNLDGGKERTAAVKDARMQTKSIFAFLHCWMNSTNKRDRISFACKRVNGLNETYPACWNPCMTRKTTRVFTRAILRYKRLYTPTRRMWL